MKAPPRRSKAATVSTHSVLSRNGKKVEDLSTSSVPLHGIEDGPVQVQVTHGVKRWQSSRDAGMTVETTCTVTIPCARDERVMADANDVASDLALRYTWENHKHIQKDLDKFVEWLERP